MKYSNFHIIIIFVLLIKVIIFAALFLNLNQKVKAQELRNPLPEELLASFTPAPKLIVPLSSPTSSPTPTPANNPTPKPTPPANLDPHPEKLKQLIERDMARYKATYGVFIKNLSTNQEITINPDEQFTSASLYKLAVMYSIYKLASEGKIDLEDATIKRNLYAMITYSSNEAALYLVKNYTSWQEITRHMQEIGLQNTRLDTDPLVTTPRDMATLIQLISDGKAVNLEASVQMLDLMVQQQKNDRIPVLLPPGVIVAHKTGELYDVRHDAGIVIGPKNNIILVLMSKDSKLPERVKPVMQQIAKDVYQFFEEQKTE